MQLNRRKFLKTSAGFLAVSLGAGLWMCRTPKIQTHAYRFRRYRPTESVGTIFQVTPENGSYIHSFYDVSAFSPSGRYLAVTKVPFEDRNAKYGDVADVCIIDLENETIATVYSTKGWGFQVGANLNWGESDRYIYTNDWIAKEAVCVRIDIETGHTTAFAGPMYHLHPKEKDVIGFPLDLINVTQHGYGVPFYSRKKKKRIQGAPDDQGLWKTTLDTNQRTLLVSLQKAADHLNEALRRELADGNFYFFHSKYNHDGSRIMQVLRCLVPGVSYKYLILLNFDADGNDIHTTITHPQWQAGGNHPNWHPDGRRIVMNLRPVELGDRTMRFISVNYDGSDLKLLSDTLKGSGHPSMRPQSDYLITDCYTEETEFLNADGEVPIRLIDLENQQERRLCHVACPTAEQRKRFVLRVDPHPVWSRDYTKICFNGAPQLRRQVFVADLSAVLT